LLLTGRSWGAEKDAAAEPLPPGARARLGGTVFRIPGELFHADLFPDGRAIGYIGYLRAGEHLQLTDVRTGPVQTGPRLQVFPQGRLAFSPDGKRFVTMEQLATTVWDTDTGKRLAVVEGRIPRGFGCWPQAAFSADGKRLALARDQRQGGIVYVIWDVDRNRLVSETPIATANGREADWVYVALSPDGKQFVRWAYQHTPGPPPQLDPKDDPTRTITVRDADTGKPVHQITPPGPAAGKRVCFSPDSRTLAVMGRELELWDTAKWQARARVKGLTSGHWPRG